MRTDCPSDPFPHRPRSGRLQTTNKRSSKGDHQMLSRIRKACEEERGFTLIELLIVIVILGILAAIVVFAVGGITNRGTDSACKADYKTVQTAEEAYFAQSTAGNGNYGTVAQLVAAKLLAAPSKLH